MALGSRAPQPFAELNSFAQDLAEALGIERQLREYREHQSRYIASLLNRLHVIVGRLELAADHDERLKTYLIESGIAERAKTDKALQPL